MNLPDLLPFFESWKRSGPGKFTAQCPMPDHRDSDPSVTITQDIETGKIMMYCWGCDTKAPDLVQAMGLRISDLFGDPGHPAAVRQTPQTATLTEADIVALEQRVKIATDNLEYAEEYIYNRFNLTFEQGQELQLGVDDVFGAPYLIIPFMDPTGQIVGMQGRRLVEGDPRWRSVSGPAWSKIGCFGWNIGGPVVITEGPSDALAVVGRSNLSAIAVRGASNTAEQVVDQIKEWLGDRPAVVIGDNDEAGQKFAEGISQGVGIGSWTLPSGYADLDGYLADGGTLGEIFTSHVESEPEPEGPTTAERVASVVTRLSADPDNAIFDAELMNELNSFTSEEQTIIFTRFIRGAPHGSIGDYRRLESAIRGRLRSMPTPPGYGGGGNNPHVGGGGNPIPNQPVIMWNPEDQLHVTEDSIKRAMDQYDEGEFFQASPGQYIKIVGDDLVNLKDAGLKSMLSLMGHWRVINGQQEKGHVPHDAAKMVSDPSWECSIPIIKRRVDVPFMLENGDIVSEAGFHEESGVYLLPRSNDPIKVPDVPSFVTEDDVIKAKGIIEDALEGFEFTNESSRTNLVAMTLTSPLRELFKVSPMVPLLTSTAPQSGSGKGTSIRLPLATVGIGPMSLSTTAYNGDENEFEKKLVGQLLKKTPYIFLDNIRSQVNSAVMEQMLTAPNYDGRTLGYSEVNRLSTMVLWVCTLQSTGSFNRDLTRRCIPVELTKNWKGSWKHKNIEAYLAEKRGDLIWACFVVARKWIQEGRPISNVRLDGYVGWTETIGGMLEHVLGYTGFLGNLADFRKKQDQNAMTIDGILESWLNRFGEEPHPARFAVEELDDLSLQKMLGLFGTVTPRQVLRSLERLLVIQEGYIINNTHRWEPMGSMNYGNEGEKLMFRCVPLEEN